jgi:hypothetical protein
VKRRVILYVAAAALCGGLFADGIHITRPAAAASWQIGTTEAITWDYSGVSRSATLKLSLSKDGTRLGNIAVGVPIADRSYSWTVGRYGAAGSAAAGGGYTIHIAVQRQEDAFDDTSASFALTSGTSEPGAPEPGTPDIPAPNTLVQEHFRPPAPPPADIQVVFPNGGETLHQGVEYQIQWRAPDSFGRPRVIFRKAGHRVKAIEPADVFPVKIGDTWRLSWIVGAEFARGDDYDIRLEKADGSQGDFCDRLFAIVTGEPYLVYAGPTGREMILGRWELIRWRAGNLHGPITVTLWKEGHGAQGIASDLPADARSFRWHVGLLTSGSGDFINSTDNFQIRMSSDGAPPAASQYVKLVNPGLEVTAPGGGEVHRGDTIAIRWHSARAFSGNVTVQLWRDSGGGMFRLFDTPFENIANTGSVSWRIYPKPGFGEADLDPPPVNCHYRFRVLCSEIGSIWDDGDAFTLRN